MLNGSEPGGGQQWVAACAKLVVLMEVGPVDVDQSLVPSGSVQPGGPGPSSEQVEARNPHGTGEPGGTDVREATSASVGTVPAAGMTTGLPPVRRQRVVIGAVLLVYLGLGVLANLPAWIGGVTHTMQAAGNSDPGQEVWFLAWATHAVTHLQDPLRSNWIDYPWGVDLADNTSMPLAGAIDGTRSPCCRSGGNVQRRRLLPGQLGHGRLLRPPSFTTWMLAAFAGGLLYGFSPYMIGQARGHLLPPPRPRPPAHVSPASRDRGTSAGALVGRRSRWRPSHDLPAGSFRRDPG